MYAILRHYRMTFKEGIVSDNLEEKPGVKGVYGKRIDGGAGVMLRIDLDPTKTGGTGV